MCIYIYIYVRRRSSPGETASPAARQPSAALAGGPCTVLYYTILYCNCTKLYYNYTLLYSTLLYSTITMLY